MRASRTGRSGSDRGEDLEDLAIYGGLFAAAFVAATFLPFLPASSELALGGLLAGGHGSPILLFLVATVGNVLGSVANFYAGTFAVRFAGRRWFLSERQLDAASAWFERRGSWLLLFAWLPLAGDPLTVVAGMLRVPFVKFLVLVTIGKAARYGVLVAGFGWFQA